MNSSDNRTDEIEEMSEQSEQQPSLKAWRKDKIWELRSQGYTYREIQDIMRAGNPDVAISLGTIHNDIEAKERELDDAFKNYVDKTLPYQHSLAMTNLQAVMRAGWTIYSNNSDDRTKLVALGLVHDVQKTLNDLMTSPDNIHRAIKIIKKLKEGLDQ